MTCDLTCLLTCDLTCLDLYADLPVSLAADSTVFECTDGVPAKTARCFQKDGMQMCVCSADLCNGPPPALSDDIDPPASPQEVTMTSQRDVNVTFSETSKQRQNNDTYIEAADRSGAGFVRTSGVLLLWVELCWVLGTLGGSDVL